MQHQSSERHELLLVDDEEDILLELAELLELEGYCCHTAISVHKALEQLTHHPYIGLVITDLRMPEENGAQLIQHMREHCSRQHLPIIVTSGHAEADEVADVLGMNVIDFFKKPIYHTRLLEILHRLLPPMPVQAARY
ncbi:response regulator [Pseudomonas segetis]|uniref:Response regulator receiver domain-containing protein n=1 Tax=Pseudomonas segetis TaxID=298908 RepID=A0A239DBH3_9PSED|nr:response regulator [Pseudomonas segetis]SNS29715.1 Response regulator receiver domain-containing protein [Pseudomonas segetis]